MARNGTPIADGAHQTSMCSPSTFEHVTHHGTTPCIPAYKKLLSRGDSLLHVCACCKSLLKGYKQLENPGHETGPVGMAVHNTSRMVCSMGPRTRNGVGPNLTAI
jgi:hypothetical protein